MSLAIFSWFHWGYGFEGEDTTEVKSILKTWPVTDDANLDHPVKEGSGLPGFSTVRYFLPLSIFKSLEADH